MCYLSSVMTYIKKNQKSNIISKTIFFSISIFSIFNLKFTEFYEVILILKFLIKTNDFSIPNFFFQPPVTQQQNISVKCQQLNAIVLSIFMVTPGKNEISLCKNFFFTIFTIFTLNQFYYQVNDILIHRWRSSPS